MKSLLFCFLFIAGSIGSLFAQRFFTPGYAVTASGDTIKGELRLKNDSTLLFRSTQSGAEVSYLPTQVAFFQIEENRTVTGSWEENNRRITTFLRERVKGHISLYSLAAAVNETEFVLRTPEGVYIPLHGKMAWATLNELFRDCSDRSLSAYLMPKTFQYNQGYFERVVRAYNRCKKPDEQVVTARAKFHWEAGLLAGVAQTRWNYQFGSYQYIDPRGLYSADYQPTVGGFVTIFPQKRLSMSVEAWYGQYSGFREIPVQGTANEGRLVTYRFKERYIGIPFLANFAVLNKRTRCLLRGGIMLAQGLMLEGTFSNPYLGIDKAPLTFKKGLGLGFVGGIAADWKLTNRRRIRTEIRVTSHAVRERVTVLAYNRSAQALVALPLFVR